MEDIFVEIEDEVVIAGDLEVQDCCDDIVDISELQIGIPYGDGKRIVHNHMDYARYRRPADFVSFRYSRFDRYESPRPTRNPVMDQFNAVQSKIDSIVESDLPFGKQKQEIRKLLNRYQQELRGANIRYRNLWRNLNGYDILVIQ